MIKDIDGNIIEVGDIIIRPKFSNLQKHYVLGITNKGYYVSAQYGSYGFAYTSDIQDHNGKMYIRYLGQDVLILKKNCEIPEKLKQFIKHG